MRRLFLFVLLLPAFNALGQSADFNTPITQNSIAKVKIDTFYCEASTPSCIIVVKYQDSGNADRPANGLTTKFTVPSSSPCTTTIAGLTGAMNTVRASETGSNARIQQFRILGYLADQSCYASAVTLTP